MNVSILVIFIFFRIIGTFSQDFTYLIDINHQLASNSSIFYNFSDVFYASSQLLPGLNGEIVLYFKSDSCVLIDQHFIVSQNIRIRSYYSTQQAKIVFTKNGSFFISDSCNLTFDNLAIDFTISNASIYTIFYNYWNSGLFLHNCNFTFNQTDNINNFIVFEDSNLCEIFNVIFTSPSNLILNFRNFLSGTVSNFTLNNSIFKNMTLSSSVFMDMSAEYSDIHYNSFKNLIFSNYLSTMINFGYNSLRITISHSDFSYIIGNNTIFLVFFGNNFVNLTSNYFDSLTIGGNIIHMYSIEEIYFINNTIQNSHALGIAIDEAMIFLNMSKNSISGISSPALKVVQKVYPNNIFISDLNVFDINGNVPYEQTDSIIDFNIYYESQISFTNSSFLYTNDLSLISQYFISIDAKFSNFSGNNLIFSNNRHLMGILEISVINSTLSFSEFANNSDLQMSLISYEANNIIDNYLNIQLNAAYISIIDVAPYDKSSFQDYVGSNITCNSNVVDLFGGCFHFKPPYQGNYTIIDSIFKNCYSKYMSGALDVFCTIPTYNTCYYIFTNLTFFNNSANFEGGGASLFFHDIKYVVMLNYCHFLNNSAKKGGALILDLDNPENQINIISCDFFNNKADSGASLSVLSGTMYILNSSFKGNSALRGAVLESMNSNVGYFNSCIFDNNTASRYGGIILLLDHSNIYLQNIVITNFKANFGGVAYIDSESTLFVNSSSFSNGVGKTGALIYISNGELICINTSFMNILADISVFFVDSSTVDFQGITLNFSQSTIFDLTSATMTLNKVSINTALCLENNQEGCVFSTQDSCVLELNQLDVRNIISYMKGGVFYLTESSKMIVNQGIFENIYDKKAGSLLYADSSSAEFHDIHLYNISCDLIYGYYSKIILESVFFENPENFNNSISYINIDSSPILVINNSIFTRLSANTNGGILYLSNEDLIPLNSSIINCSFSNIQGSYGGVIYIENTELMINNSYFLNNSAENGGSIYFECDYILQDYCYLGLYNNTFNYNLAENHGGAIKWAFKKPEGILSNKFFGNIARNYGNDIASFPIKLALQIYNTSNVSQITFSLPDSLYQTLGPQKASSGQKMDFTMEFYLIDEENQKIKNIDQAKLYIDIVNYTQYDVLFSHFNFTILNNLELLSYTSNFYDIAGQTSQNIDGNSWSFYFDDLTITAKPSSIVFLKVTSLEINIFRKDLFPLNYPLNHFQIDDSQLEYTYYLPVIIYPCVPGETYDNHTNTCYSCPRGTYSYYIFDESCKNCLDFSLCHGGNAVEINSGFWRSSSTSENIYRCTASLYLCEGGVNSTCIVGYTGRLCEVCEDINGNRANKNYFGLCQECADIIINMIISIPMMIGVLIILKLLTNFFMNKGESKNIDCGLIKLLILHYQMLTLIPNVNTSFGQTPNQILGGLTRNWFSYDCIFSMAFGFPSELNNRMLSITVILVLFTIFSNIVLMKWKTEYWKKIALFLERVRLLFFNNIRFKKSNNQYNKPISSQSTPSLAIVKHTSLRSNKTQEDEKIINIITYNSIWLYLIQASMLDLSFLGMRCVEIDGVSYNRYSLNYECWSQDHILWIIFLYVPHIIFWEIGLPWAMYKWLKIAKGIKKRSIVISSVGLKKKYRLWGDVLNIIRKSLVIVINTFSNENSETIPFTVFLLTSFLLLTHFYLRPYNYKILNNLDAFSLYIVFSTYYTLSYYYTSVHEELAEFFYVMLIVMHIIFVCVWFIVFFRRPLQYIIRRFFINNKQNIDVHPKQKPT